MHYVKYKKWWSTNSFRQAGQGWLKDDSYCPFPEGTNAYYEYWDEQDEYIKNGFVHEGQRIAGLHYLYLNFCPIKNKKEKITTMPDFWVMDTEHFYEIEKLMDLGPVKDPFRRPLFVEPKTRQAGASLKGCVPILYNMCYAPNSINYIGAFLRSDTDKTTKMFLEYFYHCQRYCEFGKRFIKQQDMLYYMTGYWEEVDGDKIPAGIKSELHLVSFKDNPTKGVGGACDLFIIEEAGLHPDLVKSVKYLIAGCKDGDYTTGGIIAYGAAGTEGQFKDLERIAYNPDAYQAMAYPNIWDPESPYKKVCYFIPNYSCRKGHIDADGNPNPESAIIARDKLLAASMTSDYEAYLLELSQFPNTLAEMFNNRGRKRFNTKIIEQQIAYLENAQIFGEAVELSFNIQTGKVICEAADEKYKQPIRRYPLPDGSDKQGCVEIFERPDRDPVPGLYIGSIDSYNQEDSYYSDSLGSIFIYKTTSTLADEGTHRIIVAEYTGRPKTKEEFYKTCAMLIMYYNAVVMPENEDQELVPWFINNGYEHLLADQPDIIRGYIPNSRVKRNKGIHGDINLIIPAENKIARYIDESLGTIYDGDGNITGTRLGVNRILSLGLLYELKEYVHDRFKNFDRVRTFGWTLMMESENYLQQVKQPNENIAKFLTDTRRFGNKNTHLLS
jgi:hypothetical protein